MPPTPPGATAALALPSVPAAPTPIFVTPTSMAPHPAAVLNAVASHTAVITATEAQVLVKRTRAEMCRLMVTVNAVPLGPDLDQQVRSSINLAR